MSINGCALCLEKQREIDGLTAEIKRLKDALRYKERKEKEGFFGSSTSSAKLPLKPNVPERADKKKRGARPGHRGVGRKGFDAEHADHLVQLAAPSLETCPNCGGQLEDAKAETRGVIDSAPIKARRTLYQQPCKRCPRCRRRYRTRPPAVLPRALFGNQLLANAVGMHYLHGTPLERVGEQLGVKPSSLVGAMHRLSGLFATVPDKLAEVYRRAPVKHADETKWRYEGKNGYAWLFATPALSIFRFDKTRAATVPNSIFGDRRLPGVLVVDRYTAYNKVPCDIQYCHSHLLREVQDLAKDFPDSPEVATFVATVAPLLAEAIKLRHKPISDDEFLRRAAEIEAAIRGHMLAPAQHEGIRHVQRVFVDNEGRLYHWARDRRVPAENNLAERDLRPTVIARKISFGSQSPAGAKTRGILMTVVHTLRKQGHDAAERLKSVLDALVADPRRDPYALLFATRSSNATAVPRTASPPDELAASPPDRLAAA
jgi:transposase